MDDFIEKFRVAGLFLPGRVEAQRVIRAEQQFLRSGYIGDAAKDSGIVKQRTGGAIVVNIAQF